MRIRSLAVLMSFGVLALSSQGWAAITDPVKVEQGLLAGTSGSSADVPCLSRSPLCCAARWRSALESASACRKLERRAPGD
jgi:hypothetical protein